VGNHLDGDANGTASGDWVRDFVVLPVGGPLFGASTTYATGGGNPHGVTHADFNRDGKLDLAVANAGSANLGLLLGDGAGGFAATVTVASGGSGAGP